MRARDGAPPAPLAGHAAASPRKHGHLVNATPPRWRKRTARRDYSHGAPQPRQRLPGRAPHRLGTLSCHTDNYAGGFNGRPHGRATCSPDACEPPSRILQRGSSEPRGPRAIDDTAGATAGTTTTELPSGQLFGGKEGPWDMWPPLPRDHSAFRGTHPSRSIHNVQGFVRAEQPSRMPTGIGLRRAATFGIR